MIAAMTTVEPVTTFLKLADATSATRDTILTGKERGLAANAKLSVNAAYAMNNDVVLVVPDNVVGITSSFINGLLAEVVKRAGGFDSFFPRLIVDAPPGIIASIIRDLKLGSLPPPSV